MPGRHPLDRLRWVVFQLVERCNLRCSMCYEWGDEGQYHQFGTLAELDFATFERVVSEFAPVRPYVEFFGGEPLLYPRIHDAIHLVRSHGCELAIPTNGVLIERQVDELIEASPTRIWVSLDGPEDVNDAQRGTGVFKRVLRGVEALTEARRAKAAQFPKLGYTCVVTKANHLRLAEWFFESIDLDQIDDVSLEFQNFATETEHRAYAEILRREFGVSDTPCARGYVQDPGQFVDINTRALADQIRRIKRHCQERGIRFFHNPRTVDAGNYRSFFDARWSDMADSRSRCAFPWLYLEISARGEVTPCHTFYDHAVGNVNEQSLTEIWTGERLAAVRNHLRGELFPICTACCRYYNNPLSSVEASGAKRPTTEESDDTDPLFAVGAPE